ncbi:MAG: hypothetical protein ACOWWR_05125 [Eubacteriales bacterium]
MKHMIKVIFFLLFILTVLYFGVREINYHNYQIIANTTKEVVYTTTESENLHVYFFGEEIVIRKETIRDLQDMFNSFKK